MQILDHSDQVVAYRQQQQSLALVPTMGNLHEGHLSLVQQAKQSADKVVVTIFVNPMQFGPNEDLSNYPRTLEQDLKNLQQAEVDMVFTPTMNHIYPEGIDKHSQVIVPMLTERHCGAHRPGHFTGVATIVAKLLNLIRPQVAIFGKKDYQQLAIIKKMTTDLAIQTTILGGETVREASGLAMSSRNGYLSETEKQQASGLYETLRWAKYTLMNNMPNFLQIEQEAVTRLEEQGFAMEFFSVCDRTSLEPAQKYNKELVILTAGKIGSTRLIDNIEVSLV